MSQAIINETTLSDLANVTRTLMGDSETRTPDECVNDLSGMGVALCIDGAYSDIWLINIHKMQYGVWDFAQTYTFRPDPMLDRIKFGGSSQGTSNQTVTEIHIPPVAYSLQTTAL